MEEFLSLSSPFIVSTENFNTHHGMLGIVQQMPLSGTFLSGPIPLYTLFILKYLHPALLPIKQADHLSLWQHNATYYSHNSLLFIC